MLSAAEEQLEKHYRLQAKGYDLEKLASRVCDIMHLEPSELCAPGKERKRVAARSLLCYWAVSELGISMTKIARRLNLSLAGVSQSVKRGETIVQQKGYNLIDS